MCKLLNQQNAPELDIKDVDLRNRINQKIESVVPPCKNNWDKFVENDNVWKPQPALKMKTHNREAGESVNQLMCKLLNQQNAPELDTDTFDGNPMEFHYFVAIFHEVVEKKIDDAWVEAKEMVKTSIQLPSEVGFKTEKGLMHKKYGDPLKITAAYRNQIKKWPQIKAGDSDVY